MVSKKIENVMQKGDRVVFNHLWLNWRMGIYFKNDLHKIGTVLSCDGSIAVLKWDGEVGKKKYSIKLLNLFKPKGVSDLELRLLNSGHCVYTVNKYINPFSDGKDS